MLATGIRTRLATINARRQKHTLSSLQSTQLAPKPGYSGCVCRETGCLPLLIFAPFLAAIFAVWSILATIQFIIVTAILLAAAAATAFLVLPQVRSAAKLFFSSESEDTPAAKGGPKRGGMVIDVEPEPDQEVSKAYKDLDDDLDRFDRDLRNRSRR